MIRRFIARNFSTVQQFNRIDIKLGKIVEIELNPNSEELYLQKVDLGDKLLEIGSKLVKHIPADQLLGKNVLIVTNLKPRKLAGVMSNGMLLAASKDEVIKILSPITDAKLGTKVHLQNHPIQVGDNQTLPPKLKIYQRCFQFLRTNQKGECFFLNNRLMINNQPIISELKNAKIN